MQSFGVVRVVATGGSEVHWTPPPWVSGDRKVHRDPTRRSASLLGGIGCNTPPCCCKSLLSIGLDCFRRDMLALPSSTGSPRCGIPQPPDATRQSIDPQGAVRPWRGRRPGGLSPLPIAYGSAMWQRVPEALGSSSAHPAPSVQFMANSHGCPGGGCINLFFEVCSHSHSERVG